MTVEDTGDHQEVQIKVTLTIDQQPSPIVATKTIDAINAGESKTVTFTDLGQVAFATRTTVKVDVQPVEGEANADNNSAEYPSSSRSASSSGSGLLSGRCRMDRRWRRRCPVVTLLAASGRGSRSPQVRAAQSVLLGGANRDLADFAVSLQMRVDDLHRAVDEVAAAISRVDRRADAALARTAVVRYDAYEGAGGRQSASVAFLDSSRSGVIVSAIQGRDYARVYVKELTRAKR